MTNHNQEEDANELAPQQQEEAASDGGQNLKENHKASPTATSPNNITVSASTIDYHIYKDNTSHEQDAVQQVTDIKSPDEESSAKNNDPNDVAEEMSQTEAIAKFNINIVAQEKAEKQQNEKVANETMETSKDALPMVVNKGICSENNRSSGVDVSMRDNCKQEDNASDEDDEAEVFSLLRNRSCKKRKRKASNKMPCISIFDINKKEMLPSYTTKQQQLPLDQVVDDDVSGEEDPLLYYSDMHEGQDPNYFEFHASRLKNRLQVELMRLQDEKNEDIQKIQAYVTAKWAERNEIAQKQMDEERRIMLDKQLRQKTQLEAKHKRLIDADQNKIDDGERWLIEQQKQELERVDQNVSQWNAINVQLQSRALHQRQQFEVKKVEMLKRTKQDILAQTKILENHHRKRQVEHEANIKELANKIKMLQENLKKTLLQLHQERFEQREKEIRAQCDPSVLVEVEGASAAAAGNTNINQSFEWGNSHDAIERHKNRKAAMNNMSIQLAVEIHIEGILAISRSNGEMGEEPSSVFLPWGVRAKKFLYSLLVGEIPSDSYMGQLQRRLSGDLVKCVVTDSRISDASASFDIASLLKNRKENNSSTLRVSTLQSELSTLTENEKTITMAHKEASLELERETAALIKFQEETLHFLDQKKMSNPDSQQKLIAKMQAYKHNHENAKQKVAMLRNSREMLANKKEETMDKLKKDTKQDDYSLDTIVEILMQVFTQRRAQVASDKKSFDNTLPEEMKQSFRQKMLQRRITITLRPNVETLVNDVKQLSSSSDDHKNLDCFDIVSKTSDASLCPALRVEQLLYLALHPYRSQESQEVPQERLTEPGWKLMLDNPKMDNPFSLLPPNTLGMLNQHYLSACCSSGRQMSSLVKPRHVQTLVNPISFAGQMSAPAETSNLLKEKGTNNMIDPMTEGSVKGTSGQM